MSLDDVVTLNITKATSAPSRAGFGTPLLMVYHTVTASVVATYKSVKALTDAGFPVTHPAVKMATAVFSQNPRPPQVVIGKRTLPFTQTVEVYPVITTAGYHYQFTVVAPSGASWDIDYTVPVGASVASICTALAPLIKNGNVDINTTANPTNVSIAAVVGKLFDLRNLPNPDHFKIKDVTTDPGIATDLSAVEAIDSTSWYGVLLDHAGKAEILAAAAWIEARRKIFGADVSDSEIADNVVTNDVGSTLKTSAYARTFTLFSQSALLSWGAAAWLGVRFPTTPGAANWAFCTLAGVPASNLTDGQKTVILGKNVNTYTPIAQLNSTQNGFTASGEFIDITHGTDWLYARLQERIFGTIKAASDSGRKIPFTDSGVDTIRVVIMAQLEEGITNGFLAADPAPTVTFPKVKDISPADRANRTLPNGEFTATLAGAINKVELNGFLSV